MDTGPAAEDEEPAPTDESTKAGSPAEPPAAPPSRAREQEVTPPAPTASPTTTPDATDSDGLTRLEATTQCLASGISALDIVGLGECVEELLG